jgi:sortase A
VDTLGITATTTDPDAQTGTEPTSHRPRRPGRSLRFLGKTLLTAAFILGAYIVWQLWGTGIYTARQQDSLRQEINAAIENPRPQLGEPIPGGAYAILEIPAIEVDEVVVQGIDVDSLRKGPGHYPKTADPWDERGRVGIAGHRTTYGAPFWDLDQVERGDEIVLHTVLGTYEYRVTEARDILPTQVGVLRKPGTPTLVLTTCTPRFSAAMRLVVLADQVAGPSDATAA